MKNNLVLLERNDAPVVSDVRFPLAAALRKAGIKPFKPESVVAYKEAMLKPRFQLTKKNLPSTIPVILAVCIWGFAINTGAFWLLGCYLSNLLGLGFSLGHLGWIPAVAVSLASCISDNQRRPWVSALQFLIMGSTVWIPSVCGTAGREWKEFRLGEYKAEIPMFVNATIFEVRFHCPQALFFIEELDLDPFLRVYNPVSREKYHIEVWAEPKFTATRAA